MPVIDNLGAHNTGNPTATTIGLDTDTPLITPTLERFRDLHPDTFVQTVATLSSGLILPNVECIATACSSTPKSVECIATGAGQYSALHL